MSTKANDQDVMLRLKKALAAASKRLSAEQSQSKSKSAKSVDLHDGNHEVAVVKEQNERILTPKQTADWNAQHKGARKQPMELDAETYGLPKVRGFDLGGIMSAVGNEAKQIGSDIKSGYNKMAGGGNKGQDNNQQDTDQDTDQLDAPVNKAPAKAPAKTNWNDVANSIPDAPASGNYISHPASELAWAYDKGGMVDRRSVRNQGERPEINWEGAEAHTQEELQQSANEGMQHAGLPKIKLFDSGGVVKNTSGIPENNLYDDGGEIETEDAPGQRELARDLIQPEANRGRIIPSHGNVVVSADTDPDRTKIEPMSGGAKMTNLPYYEGDSGMDTSNPAKTQMVPASTKPPLGRVGGMNPTAQTVPAPAQRDLEGQLISAQQDKNTEAKGKALESGNIADIGRSLISERVTNDHADSYLPKIGDASMEARPVYQGDASMEARPAGQAYDTTAVPTKSALPVIGGDTQPYGNQDLISDKQMGRDYKKLNQENAHAALQSKLADVDQKIDAAQAEGTVEGDEKANRLQLYRMELAKQGEWGKEASSHPGFLGKIGHYAAKVAEGAGTAMFPGQMEQLDPHSDIARASQREGYRANIAEDTKESLENAQAKAAGQKANPDKVAYKEIPGGAVNPATGRAEPAFYDPSNIDAPIKFGNVGMAPKELTAEGAKERDRKLDSDFRNDPTKMSKGDRDILAQSQREIASGKIPEEIRAKIAEPPVPASYPEGYADKNYVADLKKWSATYDKAIDSTPAAQSAHELHVQNQQFRQQAENDRREKLGGEAVAVWNPETKGYDMMARSEAPRGATVYNDTPEFQKGLKNSARLQDVTQKMFDYETALHTYPSDHLSADDAEYMQKLYDKYVSAIPGGSVGSAHIQLEVAGLQNMSTDLYMSKLSPSARERMAAYIVAKTTALEMQRIETDSGRMSQGGMDLDLGAIPRPTDQRDVADRKLKAFNRSVDTFAAATPKAPHMESPAQVRARLSGENTKATTGAPSAPQGATGTAMGSDHKEHYHDAQGKDLGIVTK